MFGKLDYWRIYFSLTVKVALSLLNSCCGEGAAGGRLRSWADSSSSSAASPALRRPPAGPAGLGQSSSWRVFSYVPRKMKPPRLMAAIRGTTPANKLKERERGFQRMRGERMLHGWLQGFGKQSQEKFSLAGFLNPNPPLTEGTCLGFPNRALPSLVVFNPSPHSSGAEAKVREATGHVAERGAQTHPHKGLQTDGECPILRCPHPASAGGPPLSARSSPPQTQPCSPQRLSW